MHLDGAFAARARVDFVLAKAQSAKVAWSVDAACTVTDVPPHLAHARFERPFSHKLYSPRGEVREETLGPGTASWTPLRAMSRFLPIAVVMTEDGGVFRRDGFNRAQIEYAFATDLAERRFARGASTLTMQLAKNLFLSRDKVLSRKLEEIVLTLYLSQRFTKDDILELYLNVVEFGPDIYGVRAAAAHYFGKGPANLTLAESLFLASLLPSPVKLHGLKNPNGVPDAYTASFHHLMDLAQKAGLITEAEMETGKAETIVFRSH
jgi:membrane peptidoglycan carboxypeptidase